MDSKNTSQELTVQIEEAPSNGRAFINNNDKDLAEMTFSKAGDKIIVDHTIVDDSLRGQGVGRLLLNKLVEYAKNQNMKIFPLCPYVKSVFDKDATFAEMDARK